jgi:anaerobic selenocysteine-containing dehydrogenase
MVLERRTTCIRDCPDTCGIVARVEEGRVVEHRGDDSHGVTRGLLCWRGNNYLKRFYHPDRLLHPLVRAEHGWQQVSWDDALEVVADRLSHYRHIFGPASVLVVNYSAIRGLVSASLGRLFWSHYGGATFSGGGLSFEPNEAAQDLDFGGDDTHAPEDLANSDAIVVWGKNLPVTHRHWMAFVEDARRKGAPLAVVDPVLSAVAQKADRFYQIRPGSDGMLALGVARLLLERGAMDDRFIEDHTKGFSAYREVVFAHPLDEVAAATDLSREQIEDLARLYAERKPLATLIGLGPAYWENGGATTRTIDALGAITGNIGVSGGGVGTNMTGQRGLEPAAGVDIPAHKARQILLPRLGDGILETDDPPLKIGWIAGANPASSAPDANRVKEALASLEFLVVVEQFMTATARMAHLVLPCTTYLEMDDVVDAYGHNWLGVTSQVVPPIAETKSDGEIYQLLAERLGFGAPLAGSMRDWQARVVKPLEEHGLTVEMLREAPRHNPAATDVPFADRKFFTPSGKFEFIDRFDPLPMAETGALRLLAPKTLKALNSQMLPEDVPEEPTVRVNPATIAELGLGAVTRVRVQSKVGAVGARLQADQTVRRDVVLFTPQVWTGDPSGVNQLREAFLTDLGESAAMNQTAVTLVADTPSE